MDACVNKYYLKKSFLYRTYFDILESRDTYKYFYRLSSKFI